MIFYIVLLQHTCDYYNPVFGSGCMCVELLVSDRGHGVSETVSNFLTRSTADLGMLSYFDDDSPTVSSCTS